MGSVNLSLLPSGRGGGPGMGGILSTFGISRGPDFQSLCVFHVSVGIRNLLKGQTNPFDLLQLQETLKTGPGVGRLWESWAAPGPGPPGSAHDSPARVPFHEQGGKFQGPPPQAKPRVYL